MQYVLKVKLPEDMAEALEKKSKALNTSKSAYVRRLIDEAVSDEVHEDGGPMTDIRLRLSADRAEKLNERAKEWSMPVKEYLSRVASCDMPPRIHLVVQDLYYVSMELNDLENSIAGVCASIRRTGDVYEQDVKMILKTLHDIEVLFHEKMTLELSDRNRLYDEARKKLFSKVRKTRKGTFEEWVYCE